MADDKSKRGSPDNKRINLGEDYERERWRKKFGISGQALRAAVDRVGTSAEKVAQYVKIKKKIGHY